MLPIIGPRTVAQLDTYLAVGALQLSYAHLGHLNDASALAPILPASCDASQQRGITGGEFACTTAPPAPVA